MTTVRRQFELQGRLQGVGFRPLVYRLAHNLGLTGWIKNTEQGVRLELQGSVSQMGHLESQLKEGLPKAASIRSLKMNDVPLMAENSFKILTSTFEKLGQASAEILPDLAMCSNCARELSDPSSRRYRYPFIQCTDCGPRYSILLKLPFDRANTTMAGFKMCDACRKEYEDPSDRRFHAQSICCEDCGPSTYLKDAQGYLLAANHSAIKMAAHQIRQGKVVAVLGVGGFHLFCDASQDKGVKRLRKSKNRESKPFALMTPSFEQALSICEISANEERMLKSSGAPIVLLKRNPVSDLVISREVAPGMGTLGVMLPYSPLHQLLMEELKTIVVATSGNFSEEPLCYEEKEAFSRLAGMADFFLLHDRPIASRVDDSVVREIAQTEVVFRAGRGYAPLMLEAEVAGNSLLALGGHQKNTLSFANEGRVVLMPHIGNLDSAQAIQDYERSLEKLIEVQALGHAQVVCDFHPDYHSSRVATRIAERLGKNPIQIQHHEAHLLSCVAEHGIRGEILGVAWDGNGLGVDGTLWGGEFLKGSRKKFSRIGHLRPFKLPGGSAAIREPRRSALGILHEIKKQKSNPFNDSLDFRPSELATLKQMMDRDLNSPRTSSIGRLFDAIAALIGVRNRCDYEGQAAVELEFLASRCTDPDCYPITFVGSEPELLDWEPWIDKILMGRKRGVSTSRIAANFHLTLATSIVEIAKRAGIQQVVLSGGCFQNKLLSEFAIAALRGSGFTPFWNQKVPPNDGGISVGQMMGGQNVLIRSR